MRSDHKGDGLGCREATANYGEAEGICYFFGSRDGAGFGSCKEWIGMRDQAGCSDGATLRGDGSGLLQTQTNSEHGDGP